MFLGNFNEYCIQFQQVFGQVYVPSIPDLCLYYQIHLEGHCHSPSLAGADLGVWSPGH